MTRTNDVQHSGAHARWAALSHTSGVKGKKCQECPSAQSTSENYLFLETGARRRSQQTSADPVQVVDERKRVAVARLRFHLLMSSTESEKLQPSGEVSTSGFATTSSDCDTCHLRTTANSCGTECLLLGNRTGISLGLLRDVLSDGVKDILFETPA